MNKINIGAASCGIAAGAKKVKKVIADEVKKNNLKVEIIETGCIGMCYNEPLVEIIHGDKSWIYGKVTEKTAKQIVEHHAGSDTPIKELLVKSNVLTTEDDFFDKQMKLVTRNCGVIDPSRIDDYISNNGYTFLQKALKMGPEEVIKEVIRSGIRGRGGGGFPAGVKWESGREAAKKKKEDPFVVCNADEGDPGAFMDRTLMESDPHAIIEGMIIGAFAIGAPQGFIYVRKEYPLALERIENAIQQARDKGFLGENILGSGFNFNINVHRGAGAFVCGESTALMASMEGRVGEPRAKYIHNVESGFRNQPTVLNNVETWANIPVIFDKGAEWFGNICSGDVSENPWNGSSGTKVFSLTGNVEKTGLIEVPMGITMKEIIYDIGGGIPNGKKFKAVQTGGPSGGCLPESFLHIEVDFDTLTNVGSMMGSGGMIVMDENICMVDVAKYFIRFLEEESCGKCSPCREGLVILEVILDRIAKGQGKDGDIERMEEISACMQNAALCELGKSAPNPVLSTIKYFRDEYEAHIKEKKCPGGICKELITFEITDNCKGCVICEKHCPSEAISGFPKEIYHIDQNKCIKCGICVDVCKFEAVTVQ